MQFSRTKTGMHEFMLKLGVNEVQSDASFHSLRVSVLTEANILKIFPNYGNFG